MGAAAIPGTIFQNGTRWWWRVRLPGQTKREAIPLIPDGGTLATDDRNVAELIAADLYRDAVKRSADPGAQDLTVAGLVQRYLEHCRTYYGGSGEVNNITLALDHLLTASTIQRGQEKPIAHLPAESFGPVLLKEIRQGMIDGEKLRRKTINQRVGIIRRMFRWAVSEELVPASAAHALAAVEGLRRGRTAAQDNEDVTPVDERWVRMTLASMPASLAAMVETQLLTGMRSGELCAMRPMDVDRRGKVWIYKPTKHKTAHHGHTRAVAIGPRAQKVLSPYLLRAPGAFCFSPAEVVEQRKAAMRKERKTPVQPSQVNRRKDDAQRKPGMRWTPAGYGRAIEKAVRAANKREAGAAAKEGRAPVLIPHWHPHQLRHTAATNVRREFGLDAARAVLGQRSLQIADTYAEIDQSLAAEAVKRLG